MNGIGIRPAQHGDVSEILDCVKSAYQHYTARLGKAPGPMLDDYARVIEEQEVYVAANEGTIIGILVLKPDDKGVLLDNVAVSPDAQGQGLGKRLVDFAERRTAELGYTEIELYTHELMTENVGMYQKWDYEIYRRVREKGYDRIYMRKDLREN